jgi:hypothetical protein
MPAWSSLAKALTVLFICATFLLAIYPEPALRLFGLTSTSSELAVRIFSGANAILLTIASGFAGKTLGVRNVSTVTPGFQELDHISFEAKSPSSICLILSSFPSFDPNKSGEVADLLKSASILANMRPLVVRNFREFRDWLARTNVTCVVADSRHYESVMQECRRHGKPLFLIRESTAFSSARSSNRVDIDLRVDLAMETISDLANELVMAFSLDTPRRIGFRGNWMTTYGLMALEQDRGADVEGVYWYAKGEVRGKCVIDLVHEVAVLEYEWSQAKNDLEIGSRNEGFGAFYLPAGYPVFLGYWYNRAEPDTVQSWCGARLTHDLASNIVAGGSFANALGILQHSVSKIVTR